MFVMMRCNQNNKGASTRTDDAAGETMKAVIVYDDFAVAGKVNAMLAGASRRANQIAHWLVHPWRIDWLNLAPDEARIDAEDAHLIVVALRQTRTLPRRLLEWLESWAAHRQVLEAGLAVWNDQPGENSRAVMAGLSRFVKQHGLNFIFDDSKTGEDDADYAVPFAGEPAHR